MIDYNKLEEFGLIKKMAIAHFGGNDFLYEKFLKKFPKEACLKTMKESYDNKKTAPFLSSLAEIRGISANLNLLELSKNTSILLEKIREKETVNFDAISEEYQNLLTMCDNICSAINS